MVLKGRTWLGGYMVRHSRWLWDLHYTGSVVAHPLADREAPIGAGLFWVADQAHKRLAVAEQDDVGETPRLA